MALFLHYKQECEHLNRMVKSKECTKKFKFNDQRDFT